MNPVVSTGALRGGFSYYQAAVYEEPPHWQADANRWFPRLALLRRPTPVDH